MLKYMMISIAALGVLAAPAVASGKAKNDTNQANDRASSNATTGNDSLAPKQYCVVDTPTGSRIVRKICKTRDAWMREDNFDPLNP